MAIIFTRIGVNNGTMLMEKLYCINNIATIRNLNIQL